MNLPKSNLKRAMKNKLDVGQNMKEMVHDAS